ncbi:Acyl-CoA N-acyltransferase [Mycena venus]|uniref:Acyl-CoA N-acyltransferase n=1 Tax=Mycena venus TaxID=2733690 RepID=A0A8H7D7U3_9AGAR|nr:Acyl-CoA N-acyltransferase [Mycena venus]
MSYLLPASMASQRFVVCEAREDDVEGMRIALWEAFQHELPRTRPLALEDPAGFAAETTARTLSTIQDSSSPFKWFVATPSDAPTTIACAVLWERTENANATPFEPAITAPRGGSTQAAVYNESAVHYRATVGERPHYGEGGPPSLVPVALVMATDPSFQGQGAGSALLTYLTKIADEEGLLSYVDASPQSVRVYSKFGWKAVGQFKFPEPSTGAEAEPVYATIMLREPSAPAS